MGCKSLLCFYTGFSPRDASKIRRCLYWAILIVSGVLYLVIDFALPSTVGNMIDKVLALVFGASQLPLYILFLNWLDKADEDQQKIDHKDAESDEKAHLINIDEEERKDGSSESEQTKLLVKTEPSSIEKYIDQLRTFATDVLTGSLKTLIEENIIQHYGRMPDMESLRRFERYRGFHFQKFDNPMHTLQNQELLKISLAKNEDVTTDLANQIFNLWLRYRDAPTKIQLELIGRKPDIIDMLKLIKSNTLLPLDQRLIGMPPYPDFEPISRPKKKQIRYTHNH